MTTRGKPQQQNVSVCQTFGHTYNSAGICKDCKDDTLLREMKEKSGGKNGKN